MFRRYRSKRKFLILWRSREIYLSRKFLFLHFWKRRRCKLLWFKSRNIMFWAKEILKNLRITKSWSFQMHLKLWRVLKEISELHNQLLKMIHLVKKICFSCYELITNPQKLISYQLRYMTQWSTLKTLITSSKSTKKKMDQSKQNQNGFSPTVNSNSDLVK